MRTLYYFLMGAFWALPTIVFAGQNLDKGLQHFIENDYKNAITFCEKAMADPADRQDASALLEVIYSVCNRGESEVELFPKLLEYADDPNPYFYVFQNNFAVLGLEKQPFSGFRSRIENFLKREDLNPTVEASLQYLLVRHYQSSYKFSKIDGPLEEIAPIMSWSVAGSFENISGSGFDKNYPPISSHRTSDQFENKYGANVSWFPLPDYTPGNWISFNNHFDSDNSILYAQSFVDMPAALDVQIRIGCGGTLKFWLNDELIIRNAKEYNTQLDAYVVNATLSKGKNRLLLQVGESEQDNVNFMVRITDRKGHPIPDLSVSGSADSYKKGLEKPAQLLPHFAEEYFRKRIETGPYPLINRILLINTYIFNQKSDLARQEIEKALEDAPKCSYLRYNLIEIFNRDNNKTSLNATLEKLKADDPDNVLSVMLFYQEAVDIENYKESRRYLDKYKNSPWADQESALTFEIAQAAVEGKYEMARQLVETGYKKYPYNVSFVALKYAVVNDEGNTSGAIKILKDFLKDYYDPELKMSLAGDYFQTGNPTYGISLITEMLKDHPENISYPTIMAKLAFGMGKYPQAEKHYKECLAIAPFIGSYHIEFAKTLQEGGKFEEAIPYYKKGLKYDPYDYDALRDLRQLEKKEDLFDSFEKTNVYTLVENSPDKSEFPDDNSIVLLDETQMVVYEEGGVEEKRIMVVKILTPAGVDRWKEYGLPYSYYNRLVLEKAEVIKPDGEKLKGESNYSTIVFTGLEPGDVIYVEYKKRRYFTGTLARHFWKTSYFKYGYPIQKVRFGLILPADKKIHWKVENGNIKPQLFDEGEFKRYDWSVTDQEPIPQDAYLPDIADIAPTLHLTTLPDWNFVSSWYYDLADGMIQSDYEIQELAKELFGNEPNLTDEEIVDRIYNFVVKEIHYSSLSFRQSGLVPQLASRVLTTRIGDCKDVSTLFVALCKEADIPASLVLVNTRSNGLNALALPSIDFNHCIAKVQVGGKDYYTELTSDYSSFSTFSPYLKGAFALEINEGDKVSTEPIFLNPATRKLNMTFRKTEVALSDNQVNVTKTINCTGYHASTVRNRYRDLGESDRLKYLQERLARKYSDVNVKKIEFGAPLESLNDTLQYEFEYELNRPFSRVAGMSLLKVPFSDQFSNNFITQASTRETPLELWSYTSSDTILENMSLVIPEGMVLAELPKDVKINSPFLDYALTFKLESNVLAMTRLEVIKASVIEVEEYPEFKQILDKIVRSDDLQLGFREKE